MEQRADSSAGLVFRLARAAGEGHTIEREAADLFHGIATMCSQNSQGVFLPLDGH